MGYPAEAGYDLEWQKRLTTTPFKLAHIESLALETDYSSALGCGLSERVLEPLLREPSAGGFCKSSPSSICLQLYSLACG